jgi:hypothetical protein
MDESDHYLGALFMFHLPSMSNDKEEAHTQEIWLPACCHAKEQNLTL